METTSWSKPVMYGIMAVAVVLGIIFWFERGNAPSAEPSPAGSNNEGVQTGSSTRTGNPGAGAANQGANFHPAKISAYVVTPAPGESWTLDKTHEIRWTRQAKGNGGIAVISADSKTVIGWIAQSLVSAQTNYSWDTISVFLSRSDPQKKSITAGSYRVRVVFDAGSNFESDVFTVAESQAEKIISSSASIRNQAFSPVYIQIKKGGRVAVINAEDRMPHTLQMGDVTLDTIAPGESYVFSSAALPSGAYELKIKGYAAPRLSIVVQ